MNRARWRGLMSEMRILQQLRTGSGGQPFRQLSRSQQDEGYTNRN
jgi:hypothetical protein